MSERSKTGRVDPVAKEQRPCDDTARGLAGTGRSVCGMAIAHDYRAELVFGSVIGPLLCHEEEDYRLRKRSISA